MINFLIKKSLQKGNIFAGVCHSVHGSRACVVALGVYMVAPGGHAWLFQGDMRGCSWGCTWLMWGRHAWLLQRGLCGCSRGACMVALGGIHGCSQGGHAWDMKRYRDMINERVVCILLECILV